MFVKEGNGVLVKLLDNRILKLGLIPEAKNAEDAVFTCVVGKFDSAVYIFFLQVWRGVLFKAM